MSLSLFRTLDNRHTFNVMFMIVENIVLNIKGMSSWDVIDLLDERVDRMLKEHNL